MRDSLKVVTRVTIEIKVLTYKGEKFMQNYTEPVTYAIGTKNHRFELQISLIKLVICLIFSITVIFYHFS